MLSSQKSLLPAALQRQSPRLQLHLLPSTSTCENKLASVSLSKSSIGYIYRCYVLNPNKLKTSVSPDGFTRRVAVKSRSADISRLWRRYVFPYWTNPESNCSVIDSLKATGQQNRFAEEGSRGSLDHTGGIRPRWLQQWTSARCLDFSTEESDAITFTCVQLQHTSPYSQWYLFPVRLSENFNV